MKILQFFEKSIHSESMIFLAAISENNKEKENMILEQMNCMIMWNSIAGFSEKNRHKFSFS